MTRPEEVTALEVIEGPLPAQSSQPMTLFGTADPVEVLERAVKVATALADVLRKRHLYATIRERNYVTVEGWTLLGSMLGVFPQIEWTRKLEDGWEARAVATVASTGRVVGAGEAQCTRSEGTWRTRDDYALRAMAQTRAISRALRGPLDFLVKIAGYESTPSEEMPDASAEKTATTHEAPPSAPTSDGQGAGGLGREGNDKPSPPRTPTQIADEARSKLRREYDDTDVVCPSCGRKEALRPQGHPQFCAAKEGGCGYPKRGQPFELISYGEFRSRQDG